MSAPENPPAFPGPTALSAPGMTLRDWFAGQALISLDNAHHGNDWGTGGKEHGPICARKAYAIADAMLAARIHSTEER